MLKSVIVVVMTVSTLVVDVIVVKATEVTVVIELLVTDPAVHGALNKELS